MLLLLEKHTFHHCIFYLVLKIIIIVISVCCFGFVYLLRGAQAKLN